MSVPGILSFVLGRRRLAVGCTCKVVVVVGCRLAVLRVPISHGECRRRMSVDAGGWKRRRARTKRCGSDNDGRGNRKADEETCICMG